MALSALHVRPASSMACALQNAMQASTTKRLTEVGISAPRSTIHTSSLPSSSSSSSSSSSWVNQRAVRVEHRCRVHASSAAAVETAESPKLQSGTWTWRHDGNDLNIHYVEMGSQAAGEAQETLLLLPTLSDVSTTEEWHAVAEELVANGKRRAVIVDWPGLGLSDRPALEYTVDVLEKFLVDFVTAANGPLAGIQGESLVVIGGGHAASIAVRAVSQGLINAKALAAVAPTWSGPLPIVFGRSPTMESRYGLLRGTLRSPGVGWAMYKYLVSSPKNIRMQYLTHVYSDPDNVTPAVVESRTALTQRDGARFAPAAFLTGLLDPALTRDEFLSMFAKLEGKLPVLVLSTLKAPRRSRAEMEALEGAKGVTEFQKVSGALLPQEEFPKEVAASLTSFLQAV